MQLRIEKAACNLGLIFCRGWYVLVCLILFVALPSVAQCENLLLFIKGEGSLPGSNMINELELIHRPFDAVGFEITNIEDPSLSYKEKAFSTGLSQNSIHPWWNPDLPYRVEIKVEANGYQRVQKPVEIELDLTSLLISSQDEDAVMNEGSMRVVEISSDGKVLDAAVPFQFDKATGYEPRSNVKGNLVFILTGTTSNKATRRYHLYFRADGIPHTSQSVPTYVTLTDGVMLHGAQENFKIETLTATYFYQKQGAGFSSILDRDGNDWISYRPMLRGDGEFRGLPKFGHPEKLFHAGYTKFKSRVVHKGPIKIEIYSESTDGKSASTWEFYPTFAKLTLHRIKNPNFWFLYEGTPGGYLDPDDYIVRSSGEITPASKPWSDSLPWVYFGASESEHALFLIHHEEDDKVDSYVPWPYERDSWGQYQTMTVFGFGRKGHMELTEHIGELTETPAHFTIGIADNTENTVMSTIIESAYQDLEISIVRSEKR